MKSPAGSWDLLTGVLCALLLSPGPANGQTGSGEFRGTITHDSSRAPVEGVEVAVEGIGTRRSAADGKFSFPRVVPGLYVVKIRHPGFQPVEGSVRLAAGEMKDLTFAIWPIQTDLPTVNVRGKSSGINSGMADFERRREEGFGKFLTPEDFRGRENATLTEALRSKVPDLLFVQLPNGGTAVASRRAMSLSFEKRLTCPPSLCGVLEDKCYMQVWVDGQRLYTYHPPAENLGRPPNTDDFPVTNILGVEIYRGPASTPLQFNTPGASCGTLVIWTGARR